MERTDIVDVIARYEAALVLDALLRTGVLEALRVPLTATELAKRCALKIEILEPLLAYAATSCTFIDAHADGSFSLSKESRIDFVAHMLNQYVGGYGPALGVLDQSLRGIGSGSEYVNLPRHAAAFAVDDMAGSLSEAARIILDLGVTGVIELGCGGGQTLCALATANPNISALGIDSNPEAVAVAKSRIHTRGLTSRIQIQSGDAIEVLAHTDPEGKQVVLAASVLNGLWQDHNCVSGFISALGRMLPGRLLIVCDYYSHLSHGPDGTTRTLLHDVVQVASGQGLPPATRQDWETAYKAGGAQFLHAFEARGDGIDRFIHLVLLSG